MSVCTRRQPRPSSSFDRRWAGSSAGRRGLTRQRAWLYIPDDPRLRAYAAGIAEQRRHSLRKDERDREPDEEADRPVDEAGEQLSLFAVISAVATDPDDPHGPIDDEAVEDGEDGGDDRLELALAPPPPLRGADDRPGDVVLTRREEKQSSARRTRAPHGSSRAAPGSRMPR